ncbi:MAG: hypothetical protein ABJE47_21865 [bacterium]
MSARRLVLMMLVAGGVACLPSSSRHIDANGLSDYQRHEQAELQALAREGDTTYKRRMLDYIRRARLVPTDSLARLYAAVPTTPVAELWRLRMVIGCEGFSLTPKHGTMPAARAMARMKDSLQKAGYDMKHLSETYMSAPGPPMELSLATCGEAVYRLPRVPDSLSNLPYPARFQLPSHPKPITSGLGTTDPISHVSP